LCPYISYDLLAGIMAIEMRERHFSRVLNHKDSKNIYGAGEGEWLDATIIMKIFAHARRWIGEMYVYLSIVYNIR